MINAVILTLIAALAAFTAYRFASRYQAATGTPWQKLLTAAKGSATVLWQYIVAAGGILMTWSVNAADAFNLPDVRNFVQAHLSPELFGLTLVAVALIGLWARLRTLST